MKTYSQIIAETDSRMYGDDSVLTPKAKKKPIVNWSEYDKWKSSLSPADAKAEEKRIADVHKRFKLSRSEKEHWKGIGHEGGRGGFDGGHGPSPGSRWI